MPGSFVVRSALHCIVTVLFICFLPSVVLARALCHARMHEVLAHCWHSQIPSYLLTHLLLLQFVISNLPKNNFQQRTSLNMLYSALYM